MRERSGGIVVHRQDLASQRRQPLRTQKRTRAVTTINCDGQFPRSDRLSCKTLVQHLDVFFDRVCSLDCLPDRVPRRFRKFTLMKNVEQFFALRWVEIEPVAANKLQRVPLPRIVTGSDRNPTVSLEPLNRQLHARRWTDAEV